MRDNQADSPKPLPWEGKGCIHASFEICMKLCNEFNASQIESAEMRTRLYLNPGKSHYLLV